MEILISTSFSGSNSEPSDLRGAQHMEVVELSVGIQQREDILGVVREDLFDALQLGSTRRASARQPRQQCNGRGGACSHGQRRRTAWVTKPHHASPATP